MTYKPHQIAHRIFSLGGRWKLFGCIDEEAEREIARRAVSLRPKDLDAALARAIEDGDVIAVPVGRGYALKGRKQ